MLQVFKVSDIAIKLGKSKTSVYNRISKLKIELKPYKKTLNGVVHYDEEGFEIIKNSYSDVSRSFKGVNKPTNNLESNALNLLMLEKDKQIERLEKQLEYQSILLEKKEESLAKALEVADKTQHLLAMEKQIVLQLQEPPMKKSFWDRFKKGDLDELS